MSRRTSRALRRALVPLAACAAALAAAPAANAITFTVAPGGPVTLATDANRLEFSGNSLRFRCSLSLSGSLSAGPHDTATAPIYTTFTLPTFVSCTNLVTFRFLNPTVPHEAALRSDGSSTSPWVQLQIYDVAFQIRTTTGTCVYEGVYSANLAYLPTVGSSRAVGSTYITPFTAAFSLQSGSGSCETYLTTEGTNVLSPTQTFTRTA